MTPAKWTIKKKYNDDHNHEYVRHDDEYNSSYIDIIDDDKRFQMDAGITGHSPVVYSKFAPHLTDLFIHTFQTDPTLKIGRKSSHQRSHSEGFTIKTKYEKNADKKEAEYSQWTNKKFIKVLLLHCTCAGKTTLDASVHSKRQTCSRLKGCQ